MYRNDPARPGMNTRERRSRFHSLVISPQYLHPGCGDQQTGDRVCVYYSWGWFDQPILVHQLFYWDRDGRVVGIHLGERTLVFGLDVSPGNLSCDTLKLVQSNILYLIINHIIS